MEFSDIYKQSGGKSAFSPDGSLIATIMEHQLIIRSAETMSVLQIHKCKAEINLIEWSCDSMYILCAMFNRGLVQVWSIEQTDWTCSIDEGAAGLTHARWSPDGRHVLTSADFQLRITVWSLVSHHVNFLKFPKYSKAGCAFSHDGKYMAVLERNDGKDYVGVFACKTWEMATKFQVATIDAADLCWSPDDSAICVWDYVVNYKVCVYQPDGRKCLKEYSAYADALGVKTLTWAPSSQILAVGSYDQKVRLLNNYTWGEISTHDHPSEISDGRQVIYREVGSKENGHYTTKYEIANTPCRVDVTPPNVEKPFPKLGVGLLDFSADSRFFATRNDNMPKCVWIWDVSRLRQVAVLYQLENVRAMQWHPNRSILAIASGTATVHFWSPNGGLCAQVPAKSEFKVLNLRWSPDGKSLALLDNKRFSLAFTESGLEAVY